jgi:cytochrome c556
MKRTAFVLATACTSLALALGAATAVAQAPSPFQKPEDAIKYRQSALTVMANQFGRLAPVVREQAPFDAATVQKQTALLVQLAALPWEAFGPGTEGGKARDEVWKETPKFQQAATNMQTAMAKLDDAAKTGELAQIKTAYGAVGASCKACHDSFRNR